MLLPNMWTLQPAGKQVMLGDFPVNIALHPSGKWAAILHSGYGQHEITIVQISDGEVISRVPINESYYGLVFSADGQDLYCSGAGDEVIHHFEFRDGFPSALSTISLRNVKERGIPAGISLSSDGRLFVANLWGQSLDVVNLRSSDVRQISLSTNRQARPNLPDAHTEDEAAITKRAEVVLENSTANDPFPYGCVFDARRNRIYASFWAQACVGVLDAQSGQLLARWATDEHPNEMLLTKNGKYLFVANANRNTVSILDTETGRRAETLLAELKPNSPPGSTPNSLALSPDERLLFVANANINAVAVFDIKDIGKSRSLGFIPVGWYPTSVRVTPDGKKLLVANGKGLVSKANRNGPQPGHEPPATVREYIGGLLHGTLSIIDLARLDKFEDQMKECTARAYQGMPALPERASISPGNPIPSQPGETSPIKYCIYIVKENRTYDQVLGDMPEGRGDPTLCLFGENITPNHHKLAREFVLLDNFYVESEVSADGHEWTMGAYATDFVEKHWPLSYGHNKHKKYPYPAEGNFEIATPAGGYLWDAAKDAGISYRSYGEFIANGKTTNAPGHTKVKALEGHFDPYYRTFDLDYPDVKRAERFISELKRFEAEGDMPRLTVLRLPNDHTSGTTAGKIAPLASVADNDLALGMVIEALSRSKFWKETAVFIVEDDAQNGPDHIDAHRSIAFVVSPYTRHRGVDSTMYTTSSMLHSMELILGLRSLSQFDAAAPPMFNSFHAKPDLHPYIHEPARIDLTARNVKTAYGSELSRKMNFAKEDAVDDLLLNKILWHSIKGPSTPLPAPTRAAFVFPNDKKDDDD
jgi:DNA-binding beta-propeller fold protein YncE